MHKQVYRKFFLHFSIIGIAVSLLTGFYDVIFGFIWEFIHIFMEMLEQILDNVIEHIFHTELHETQLIVFYILLVFGGFMAFFIWKILVMAYEKGRQTLFIDWSELKIGVADDWGNLSTTQKLIGMSLFVGINLLILSLVMCCMF
jgi:hypothetical protein